MILWTIKKPEFWDLLQEHGTLHACPPLCYARGFLEESFEDSYGWMIDQMRKRLPSSPHRYPIWAWYQRYNETKRRPDLRGWDYRGYRGVRIEFEIDDSLALLSDFSAWHCVLNRCYLGTSEDDDESFYQEIQNAGYRGVWELPDGDLRKRVSESWERIFDLDWYAEKWTEPRKEKSIQATLWEIRLDMVRNVTHFGLKAKQ